MFRKTQVDTRLLSKKGITYNLFMSDSFCINEMEKKMHCAITSNNITFVMLSNKQSPHWELQGFSPTPTQITSVIKTFILP